MEKQKKWQLFLIISVLALTVYNILPSVFYYCQPLKSPVDTARAETVVKHISERVNTLEEESREWLQSFCRMIQIKPQGIESDGVNFTLRFAKAEEASCFAQILPRAGSLIPFAPAQLHLGAAKDDPNLVTVQRRILTQLTPDLFTFAPAGSDAYRNQILDRATHIARTLAGPSLTSSEIFSTLGTKGTISLSQRSAVFASLSIDWDHGQILLAPHVGKELSEQTVINEAARIVREAGETLSVAEGKYTIAFHDLADCSSLLLLDLEKLVQREASAVKEHLKTWQPKHPDLQQLSNLNAKADDALRLSVHTERGLSLVAHGLEPLLRNYEQFPNSEQALLFSSEFKELLSLLQTQGFQAYPAANKDIVFEQADLLRGVIVATREPFQVKGTGKYAALEMSTVEQRLLAENKIDTKIHEDLMKWEEEYNAAQIALRGSKFDVPAPTQSVFFSNLMLSCKKFFRGDERKVIRWGLDLSGGKTVQIELRDSHNHAVTNDDDLKQGINELYQRVNKMGVSEVAIRQVGHQIALDFPGSQNLSASELIKASSMYFHIVNETFSSPRSPHFAAAQRFLTDVWNEALVSGHKDADSLQQIAWNHLHSKTPSEAVKMLLEQGLTLQSPTEPSHSQEVDTKFSKIAMYRGDDWHGQGHPLLLVFCNFAMEGSSLDEIQPGYDPQKGNYLSFSVGKTGRDSLHNWTNLYSKESVAGTSREEATRGAGWRMAVILNDSISSAPSLEATLKDSASISGSFSQREVMQLAADLKAGSLTFTPHILSEKNVSPELGANDRFQGVLATFIALLLVIASMIGYYRFAGFVASVAVVLNLLILWATLQNMGAALSLAGIAGIILTVGMAVDANVLVFERIKEEFAISGKIASAIKAGYEKAYTAIVDSNVTTIIAALILLNFDAGPIKGFALTLIIGIVSSMFTALFLTRYYFAGWVQNPKNQMLKMADWIQAKSIDFLKQTRLAFTVAALIIGVGCALLYTHSATALGMDFTGGHSIYLEVAPKENVSYVQAVSNAFVQRGAIASDIQIRALSPENSLRILLSPAMELPGKPFHNLPVYDGSHNPRIAWIVDTLNQAGLPLTAASHKTLDSSWTSVSGQMSDSMRNNALFGLALALFFIFIYIAVRFEYRFATAASLCLLHDVLITLGCMGLLHAFGVPVQIDLNTVAAIMTIVGYSLNDTIIVFDRIREEMRLSPRTSLPEIVNLALNTTLSRTTITSGTTLLVLIALVLFGGASLFSFALVMTIGVFFGTISSWYIAAPLMLMMHRKEPTIVVERHS